MSGPDESVEPSPGEEPGLGESLTEDDLQALRAYEESLEADAAESAEGPAEAATGAGGDEVLAQLSAQRDEYLDALRRLQAEFDNYRKRTVRQQTELLDRAAEGLLERLLPVLDALDLAVGHAEQSEDVAALQRIASLLGDVLQKDGLVRIGAVGEPFDPTVHEAVLHVPAAEEAGEAGDEPSALVDEVLRAGYQVHGRVLRPAMVKVRG